MGNKTGNFHETMFFLLPSNRMRSSTICLVRWGCSEDILADGMEAMVMNSFVGLQCELRDDKLRQSD